MADNSVALQDMSSESIDLVYIHHHCYCILMTFNLLLALQDVIARKMIRCDFLWIIALQEKAPLEEVFKHFTCTKEGLSSDEVKERLARFGYNRLEEKKVRNKFQSHIYVLLKFVQTMFCVFDYWLMYLLLRSVGE